MKNGSRKSWKRDEERGGEEVRHKEGEMKRDPKRERQRCLDETKD